MGDEALRVEILALFVAEVVRLLAQVQSAPDPLIRAGRLRAMSGAAANAGARRLAVYCDRLQRSVPDRAFDETDLTGLRAAVQEAIDQVHNGAV